ncbi:MAG TPA: hypothetical protein VIQ30_10990 [Pseudonocardia sp.]
MAGFKDFVDGVALNASELDGFLMRQTVMRFPTTTTLVNTLVAGIREVGMLAWADNTGIVYMWDGTNWIPWQSPEKTFSPIFTAGGSNITVGNSIVNSWWRYSGGMAIWNFRFVIGSTANLGVGEYALSLPVSARAEHDHHYMGQMTYFDQSVGTHYHRGCATLGTTTSIGIVDSNGTRLSATSPVAWANNDQFGISLRYPPSTGVYL